MTKKIKTSTGRFRLFVSSLLGFFVVSVLGMILPSVGDEGLAVTEAHADAVPGTFHVPACGDFCGEGGCG